MSTLGQRRFLEKSWYGQLSLLAAVCEVIVPWAYVVVSATLSKAQDGAFERRRCIVQELLKSGLALNRLCSTSWCRYTTVVARAGEGRGKILVRDAAGVVFKRSPEDFSIFEEGGIFPWDWVVGVWVGNFDDVVSVSTSPTFTCITSLSIATRVAVVVCVWTCKRNTM